MIGTGNPLDTDHLHVSLQVGDSVMQLLQGVGCQGGGGLPSVHLHGTLTLGLLGPESRLYRGGTPRRSLDWLGLRSRPHEGGTPRRPLDWLG